MELEPDDIRVTPSGVTGPDLQLSPKAQKQIPFTIEVKNQERLNIWASLKQAQNHKKDSDNPLLVFTRNRENLYACLLLDDFLSLIS
ncbi:MAG: hypothetical protein AB8C84_13120 [Oligoflexales bacterium]